VTAHSGQTVICPICDGRLSEHGRGVILGHIDVVYQRCVKCGLVLLPDPGWLDEAYSDAISSLDVGLLSRCQRMAALTADVVRAEALSGGRFLDWAGGYGTLTRLLRDAGFDFRHWDPHCTSLFAIGHEGDPSEQYDLVTAFEVVEHLARPVEELGQIASHTDRLLFTTYLLPEPAPPPGSWWYYMPESGQHITFHTDRSLRVLADRLGYGVVSNGMQTHLFHRGRVRRRTALLLSPAATRARIATQRIRTHLRSARGGRPSLQEADHAAAIERVRR
jgi:hypothetical protein